MTPSSVFEIIVMTTVKIRDVRAESRASFAFIEDPIITSVFPSSLPANNITTTSIDICGVGFHNISMVCVFNSSLPSNALKQRRHMIHSQPAVFRNSTYIKCPSPPTMESFFSSTDLSWSTNATLLDGAILEVSVTTGDDWSFKEVIQYNAREIVASVFPQSGPRSGGTKVLVQGENFLNTTSLTCRFGLVAGLAARYSSSTKVICTSPHFPFGHGRVVVPVNVANNGVDFSKSGVFFEFHEPLVIKEASPLIGANSGGSIVNVTLDEDSMKHTAIEKSQMKGVLLSHIVPKYGPTDGSNIVKVFGSGFIPNPSAACRFGGVVTSAYISSVESMECKAPKAAGDAVVEVAVSVNNGVDWTEQSLAYIYLPIQEKFEIQLP